MKGPVVKFNLEEFYDNRTTKDMDYLDRNFIFYKKLKKPSKLLFLLIWLFDFLEDGVI